MILYALLITFMLTVSLAMRIPPGLKRVTLQCILIDLKNF